MIEESVVKEIMRRFDILNSQPNEELLNRQLTSRMLFRANLALIGYPFQDPPSWMDEEYLKPVMDEYTFQSDNSYDPIIHGLYSQLLDKLTKDELND
jgi:hypothetical protein